MSKVEDAVDDSDSDEDKDGGYLNEYPDDVKVVVEALKSIEFKQINFENKYQREILKLDKKVELPLSYFMTEES